MQQQLHLSNLFRAKMRLSFFCALRRHTDLSGRCRPEIGFHFLPFECTHSSKVPPQKVGGRPGKANIRVANGVVRLFLFGLEWLSQLFGDFIGHQDFSNSKVLVRTVRVCIHRQIIWASQYIKTGYMPSLGKVSSNKWQVMQPSCLNLLVDLLAPTLVLVCYRLTRRMPKEVAIYRFNLKKKPGAVGINGM